MGLLFSFRRLKSLLVVVIILAICYCGIYLIYRARGKSHEEAHKFTIHSAELAKWIIVVSLFLGFIAWAIYDSFR